MKKPFNKIIAKKIALKSFAGVIDSVLGNSDPDYHLSDDTAVFEQNFEEDLEEMGITITTHRLKIISDCYEKYVKGLKDIISNYYDKESNKVTKIKKKTL